MTLASLVEVDLSIWVRGDIDILSRNEPYTAIVFLTEAEAPADIDVWVTETATKKQQPHHIDHKGSYVSLIEDTSSSWHKFFGHRHTSLISKGARRWSNSIGMDTK